jgi:prepilin-type N-terminal cleavage/methylation domain-containing protein
MERYDVFTSQRGLSLVETMVALMVIVIGLAGVQRFFPQGLATGRHSLERTQATLLGKGKLEELRLQGFAALAGAAPATASPAPFLDGQQQVVLPRFRWQAEVLRSAEDLLEVHLRVVWPWPQQTYQVGFATYVGQR